MIRLCLAGKYPQDENKIGGGVAYIMHLLALTLAERSDVDLHVVSPAPGIRGTQVVKRQNITFHYVGSPKLRVVPRMLGDSFRIARVLRELKPDVVNSHFTTTTNAALRADCKVVYTIHGILHKEAKYSLGLDRLAPTLQAVLEPRAIMNSDAVISVSQYGLDACRQWIRSPAYVVRPPVHDMFFQAQPEGSCSDILYIGTIRRLKNVVGLLKALSHIRDALPAVKLVICGPITEPDYHAELTAFIERNSLSSNVEFAGVVDSETICRLLNSSACLVLPSYQENAPVVICQAMAAARPVVASPAGGIGEMVDDGATGYIVRQDDDSGLADRVLSLLRDSELDLQMGLAGREAAKMLFDRQLVADRTLAICRSLLQ